MNFATAAGLWLGLITIPIVIFYLLKIKRHRRTVPYLKLWSDLVADKQFTTLFQRLQRWLSLLLQLLIGLCVVFAFASLTLSDSYLEEESIVLVVDTSASMNGVESASSDRSRFEAAVQKVRDLCEGRSAEDEFAIVAAGAQPEVLQGFTRSTLRLREAIDRLAPTKASGDLDGAVRLADSLLQDRDHPRIAVVADAAGGAVEKLAGEFDSLRWIRVGESVPNLAIRRFQVRRNLAVDTDYLLLAVANDSDQEASCEVEISVDDNLVKVKPMTIGPQSVESETLELTLRRGAFAKAKIVHSKSGDAGADQPRLGDGLRLDDVAYAAVPRTKSFRVMLVARSEIEEEPFRVAMASLGQLVDRERSIAVPAAEFADEPAENVAKFDLVIFVNHAPESLPETGRFLCINAFPKGLPGKIKGVETNPELRDFDEEHPINRFLEPKAVKPLEARPLDLTGGEVFMGTGGGPVGVVFRESERRTVYLGFDVLSDLFFLRVAFPIVLRNVLAWMHEEESALLEPTYQPGDVIRPRFRVAGDTVDVAWKHEFVTEPVEAAAGAVEPVREKVPVRDGKFWFGDTAEPGRYWVQVGDQLHRTTVNLFDASESSLMMPEASGDDTLDIERSGFLFGRDLWPLLLLIAAVLWILEWGLYHRRLTE